MPVLSAIVPTSVLQHDAPQLLELVATNVSIPCVVSVGGVEVPCELDGRGALVVTLTPPMVQVAGTVDVLISNPGGPWSDPLPLEVRPVGARTQWWLAGLDTTGGAVRVTVVNPFPRDADLTFQHVLTTGLGPTTAAVLPAQRSLQIDVAGPSPGRGVGGNGALMVSSTVPVVVGAAYVTTNALYSATVRAVAQPQTQWWVGSRTTKPVLVRSIHLFNPHPTLAANVALRERIPNLRTTNITVDPLTTRLHVFPPDGNNNDSVHLEVLSDVPLAPHSISQEPDDLEIFAPQATPTQDAYLIAAWSTDLNDRLVVVNPNATPVVFTAQRLGATQSLTTIIQTVAANSQYIHDANAGVGNGVGRFVLHVTAPQPVVPWLGRSLSTVDNCSQQATQPARDLLLVGTQVESTTPTTVLLFNPNTASADVTLWGYSPSAAPAQVAVASVPAGALRSVTLSTAFSGLTGQEWAFRVEASVPVVAGMEYKNAQNALRCDVAVTP